MWRIAPDDWIPTYSTTEQIRYWRELLREHKYDLLARDAMWLYVRRWDDDVDVSSLMRWLRTHVPGVAELAERCRVE